MRSTRPTVFFTWFIALLAFDQALKWYMRAHCVPHEALAYPIPGVLELRLIYNEGIAFGMLQGLGVLFMPIAFVIAYGCGRYCFRHPQEPPITHISLGLLAAGALGNLIDRMVFGRVTDMISLRFVNFPVFNIADACITVGAILLGVRVIFESKSAVSTAEQPIT